MPDKVFKVGVNGTVVEGALARVLAELAFAHYPVRVDAGEGEREFGSFDEAKEYAESVLTA